VQVKYRNTFTKDVKRAERRGKNLARLHHIVDLLIKQKPLPQKYRDHALVGQYVNRQECHIEPDWLLIYKQEKESIIFERTGTHADLFK